jgi:hypothetical protein
MIRTHRVSAITLVTLLAAGAEAQALGPSPYLPLNLAPEIERDIERVLIMADRPTMRRPIAAARVLDALPAACARDAALCARVRRYLQLYMDPLGATHVSVEGIAGDATLVPNRHGLAPESEWATSAAAHVQFGDYFIVNGGSIGDSRGFEPSGSFVSTGFDFAQLDVGFRDHQFSPMTDSSMLIGTNAATMPSVTLSNYRPFTGLGIEYELFLAEMSRSESIEYQGRLTTGKPRLAGMHVAIEPAAGWSIAGNRIMQYGGGERGRTGARDFLRALFKPRAADNSNTAAERDTEFGNQAAAWTSRIIFPGRMPMSVYFEFAGEDTSFSGNYRLGNSALSMGIDLPSIWRQFDFTYEVSEWQNGWYVHGIYGDSLSNDGRIVGHWFGDARQRNDGVGGQSHMVRIGWQPSFGGVAELKYRTLANEEYTGAQYTRAHDFTLRYSYPWRRVLVGAEVNRGRDVHGVDYSRVAAFARFGAEFAGAGRVASIDEDTADDSVDYFVDAGGSASRVRIEISNGQPKYVTGVGYAPHLALGARRAVSERSDLGARIEFDRIEGATLLAVRALDYRYRIGPRFAISGFMGAARYDLATPAFGYYLGGGVQWRSLFDRFDVNFDLRYGDKLARDQLLPDEAPLGPRPDAFYDVMGATLYLSYRL